MKKKNQSLCLQYLRDAQAPEGQRAPIQNWMENPLHATFTKRQQKIKLKLKNLQTLAFYLCVGLRD